MKVEFSPPVLIPDGGWCVCVLAWVDGKKRIVDRLPITESQRYDKGFLRQLEEVFISSRK